MKNKKLYSLIFLLTIFIVSYIIRIYLLDSIPPGLNRDEASIGYTAYSLFKTGKDEYGKVLPLSFKSFGDWKLPLFIYITIPSVIIFGLTEFAVRFPSALLGSITVVLTFFLAEEFFKSIRLSIISACIFTIMPWGFFFSRNASESNVAVFIVTSGLLLFLLSFKKRFLLLPSLTLFALSFYTYHGNHVFTSLLVIGLLFIYKKYLKIDKLSLIAFFIFISLAGVIFQKTLFSADKTKISGLLPLSDKSAVYEGIVLKRIGHKDINILPILFLHNKVLYTATYIAENYLKSFSPEFLFINGGANTQHNVSGFGNLHLWQAPFLLLGIIFLIIKKHPYRYFLLYWLLISPLGASLTIDAPHTNRMAAILPLPAILTAYGLVSFIAVVRRNTIIFKLSLIALIIFISINTLQYFDEYFIHFPLTSAKNWGIGYKQVAYDIHKFKNSYKEIVMNRPDYSPYIYYLFYNQIDPERFQKEGLRYPDTEEGFSHVYKFENIYFRKIDWSLDIAIPNRLYVDWVENIPYDATESAVIIKPIVLEKLNKNNKDTSDLKLGDVVISKIIDKIVLVDGTEQFYLIETKLLSNIHEK